MSNEVSRIFQFISTTDWQKEMDYNHDGVIKEDECKHYLLDHAGEIDGLKDLQDVSAQKDIICQFWRTINTDRSGKSVVSLDSNEIENMQKRIELEETVMKAVNGIKAPVGITPEKDWKTEVKDVLMTALENAGGVTKFSTPAALKTFLESTLAYAKLEATKKFLVNNAGNTIIDVQNQTKLQDTLDEYGFTDKLPADLKSQINAAINSIRVDSDGIKGQSDNDIVNTINNKIKEVIDAYVNNKNYNELNKAILAQDTLIPSLTAEVEADADVQEMVEKLGGDVKAQLGKAIENFVNKYITKSNYAKLASEIPSLLNEFKASDFYTKLESDFRQASAGDVVKQILTNDADQEITAFVESNEALNSVVSERAGHSTSRRMQTKKKVKQNVRDLLDSNLKPELIKWLKSSGVEFNEDEFEKFYEQTVTAVLNNTLVRNGDIFKYDMKTVVDAIMTKFREEYGSQQGSALYSQLKTKIDPELAKAILNLDEAAYPAEYKAVLEKITKEYADGTIKDTAELSKRLVDEIKTLVDKGVFDGVKGDIQAAKDALVKSVTDADHTEEILDDMTSIRNSNANLTFRILDDGTVEFVEWADGKSGGIWAQNKNYTVQGYFDTARNKCEKAYADAINTLKLTDEEKEALWNKALFLTLSDTTVVESMYKEVQLNNVINSVVENYKKLLHNIAQNENARNFLTANVGLLAGRTLATVPENVNEKYVDDVNGTMTHHMTEFYVYKTTNGNDDWVGLSLGKEGNYSASNGKTYTILYWSTSVSKDDEPVNNGLTSMLNKYVKEYKAYLSVDDICACFKEAEKIAFKKLNDTNNAQNPGNAQTLYGYSNGGTKDGKDYNYYDTRSKSFLTVQAILLEVMYEMERLLDAKIMGM